MSFLIHFSGFAQNDEGHIVHGRVIDDSENPVPKARVLINDVASVFSDNDGYFEIKVNGKITNAVAYKEGYDVFNGKKKWWIEKGDDLFIFIQLYRTASFTGKILDDRGKPLQRVTVKLTGDIDFGTVTTDAKGYFAMDLPPGMKPSEATIFIVAGEDVKPENRIISRDFVKITIPTVKELPIIDPKEENPNSDSSLKIDKKDPKNPKKFIRYEVLLMDETESPLAFLNIFFGNKKYKSDQNGRFILLAESVSSEDFSVDANYAIARVDVSKASKKILVKIKQPDLLDSDSIMSEDEIVESYAAEMNMIIKGLQQEKMVLTAKAIELRKQIARLAQRLSREQNISPKKREELGRELLKLEETLEENDEAYQKAQERTREALARMKEMLELSEAEKVEISAQAKKERIIYLLVILGALGLASMFYVLGKRIKKQKDELEDMKGALEEKVEEVKQKNDRISAQTDNLKALNHAVQSQNQKMTDSIHYAETIQAAILPTSADMKKSLGDYFIIHKPKEIVSGDFYWMSQIQTKNKTKKILLAAIDCTGHGVPGGFMSMIGNTLLNEIVNKKHIYDTDKILDELNQGIKEALKQDEKLNLDGMDVCLCAMEERQGGEVEITFSGARRPLMYVKPETKEVGYLKGDPQAVGGLKVAHKPFSTQKVILSKGDVIYLTSDGLASQGTGKTGKVGTSRVKQLLAENAEQSLEVQKKSIEKLLTQFKVKDAQRDDILVLAVRV